MTEVMKKLQRKKHLSMAYESINRETIKNITRKYRADFELYGYSFELPKVKKKSESKKHGLKEEG